MTAQQQTQTTTQTQTATKLNTLGEGATLVMADTVTLGLIGTIIAQTDGLLSARKGAAVAAIAAAIACWNDKQLLAEHASTMRALASVSVSGDASKAPSKANAALFWKALGIDQRKDEKEHNDKARAAQTAIKAVLPYTYLLCCAGDVLPAEALIKSIADLGIKSDAKASGIKLSLSGAGLQVSVPLAQALGLTEAHARPIIIKSQVTGWIVDPLRFRAAIEACKPNEHETGKGLIARALAVMPKRSKGDATGGKTQVARWEAHSVAELLNTDSARELNATIDRLPLLNPKAEDHDAQYKAAKASLQTMLALANRKLAELEDAHAKVQRAEQRRAAGSL